jgi:hypothetical protein
VKARKTIRFASLAASALLAAVTTLHAAQRTPVQTWKVLLIIKPETQVPPHMFGGCRASMTRDEINAIQKALDYSSNWVYDLSGKQVAWETDVRISDIPLTSVSAIGDGKECYPAPSDVQRDLAKYAPAGKYDSVFIYWKSKGDKQLPQPNNWGRGPSPESLNMGYATIGSFDPSSLTKDSANTETFVHEWLHQVEQFYQSKGIKLPSDAKGENVGIHAATAAGFREDALNSRTWKLWYRAFMAGEISSQRGTGLGPKAWALGTMRADAARLNLLQNADLSQGSTGWRFDSWRQGNKPTNPMASTSVLSPDGKPSFYLKNRTDYDDARWVQTVRVKPNTTYVVGCYVRTKSVKPDPTSAKYGANISVLGTHGEASEQGNFNVDNWRYVSFAFDSGQRQSVDIALRNGYYSSTTTGEAWFSQPTVIEAAGTGAMTGGKYTLLSTGAKTRQVGCPVAK